MPSYGAAKRDKVQGRGRGRDRSSLGRGPRDRSVSMLSFTRMDHKGRYIDNSIHSSSELFAEITSDRLLESANMEELYNPLDASNRSEIPFNKTIEEVYSGVHNGRVLGEGVSGKVRLIVNKETGETRACKRLNLMDCDTDFARMQLIEEIDIMCMLDHPNIVTLEEIYESDSIIYLVTEVCNGGELFDKLDEQPDYHYSEEESVKIVKQILSAVVYLHSQGIVHRDLKLENFLFWSKDPDSPLKMIDFGLSKHFKYSEVLQEKVGTPYTVAPEVIRGNYDERCDVWGIGVIAYLLLCGDSPFGGCDPAGAETPIQQIRANILSGSFSFEPKYIWNEISDEAKEFISRLLNTNPTARPHAREVRNLAWLRKFDETKNDGCADCCTNLPFLNSLLKASETMKKPSIM